MSYDRRVMDDTTNARCELCGKPVDVNRLDLHFGVEHPDEWGAIERWPDGEPAIFDDTLTPEDFL